MRERTETYIRESEQRAAAEKARQAARQAAEAKRLAEQERRRREADFRRTIQRQMTEVTALMASDRYDGAADYFVPVEDGEGLAVRTNLARDIRRVPTRCA